ncbi:hypothetical protein [Nocardia wallacei]|uniref:hypothetical protein n=1 Tax=Nocardia wallacei TaxID=480035 RepID=UPI002453A1C5|nr:hypothetical protein [Nocardia wallacei]
MSRNRKFSSRALGLAAVAGALVAVPIGLTSTASAARGPHGGGVAPCEARRHWGAHTR